MINGRGLSSPAAEVREGSLLKKEIGEKTVGGG